MSVAVAHLAYETYYSTLGTSVDELGISTARMLGVSSVVVIALATAGAFVFGAVSLATLPGGRGLTLLLLAAFGTLAIVTPAYPLVIGMALLGLALPVSRMWLPLARSPAGGAIRVAALAECVLLLLMAATTIVGASGAARSESTGEEPRGFAADLARSVLYTPMRQVCVVPRDGGGAEQRLLLGTANGFVVLYDPAQRRSTRVSTAEIARMPSRLPDEHC